jgi:hypothetical protein
VRITETCPDELIPRKRCGLTADSRALIATSREPSVPFLKPIGQLNPDAISR